VQDYTRRCNTVENINIHKVIGPWDRVIFVREPGKESTACPITKASISSHFYIPLIFVLTFSASLRDFFLFLILFLTSEIYENAFSVESLYHKDSKFRPLNEVRIVISLWLITIKFPYNAHSDWLKQRALSENKAPVDDGKLAFEFVIWNFDKFDPN